MSKDKPSWVNRDMVDPELSAQENARNMLNKKYGVHSWEKEHMKEYSKIVKGINRYLRGY